MADIRAAKEQAPDPKIGTPRAKSGVAFPYYNLVGSIEVAKAIHEKAGGTCNLAQLAALLGYSGVKNGGFRSRVGAAKMFGLVEQQDEQLSVSDRGRAIVAPISEAEAERAKVQAFLAVDLFKRVFDQFDGGTLPEDVGIRNLLSTQYKVVDDRVAPAAKVMLDSAEQAGFFKASGRTRMVLPLGGVSSGQKPLASVVGAAQAPAAPSSRERGGNGGSGADGSGSIHPAILGLLKELPSAGNPLSSKTRSSLIAAFSATISFIYPDEDDPRS